MSKVWFILGAFAFIMFVVQMGALMAPDIIDFTIIKDAPAPPTIPSEPTAWDYLTYPIGNIGYFFDLMGINSAYLWVGVICSIILLGLIWSIIELIRGV